MKITSFAFENNTNIPRKYTCQGDGVNPPLSIEEVPETTQSLVLIVEDPDAPNGIWTHWILWNLPPNTQEISEGYQPKTPVLEGLNSFGKIGYGGPCPPSGIHRYFFKLFALSKTLELNESSTVSDLETAIEGEILSTAALMGTYQKS